MKLGLIESLGVEGLVRAELAAGVEVMTLSAERAPVRRVASARGRRKVRARGGARMAARRA